MRQVFLKAQNSSKKATKICEFKEICFRIFCLNKKGEKNMKTTFLATNDFTGISFWVISMAMLAATVFFFVERNSVKASWRTSVTLMGLV